MKPLVSILICSYNAEKFIESTVASVLDQNYRNFELLILDNASKDKTAEIIHGIAEKDSRVKLFVSEFNLGSYPGLNYLLERAKGKYIAINDHDDIWHPEKLARQVDFLEGQKEYVGCGTAIINWYEKYRKYFYRRQDVKSDIAWHTSLVFRNNGYRYDTTVSVATDFYFMKNILSRNRKLIYNFPEPLVLRRVYSNNLSGKWMKKATLLQLMSLKIGLTDKAALVNRYFLPQNLVEWMVIRLAQRVPGRYSGYLDFFSRSS